MKYNNMKKISYPTIDMESLRIEERKKIGVALNYILNKNSKKFCDGILNANKMLKELRKLESYLIEE